MKDERQNWMVRNLRRQTRKDLRAIADKHDMTMADLLEELVELYRVGNLLNKRFDPKK